MNPAILLAALMFLLVYGVGMFYLGVRAAVDDYEARLARARSIRFHQETR